MYQSIKPALCKNPITVAIIMIIIIPLKVNSQNLSRMGRLTSRIINVMIILITNAPKRYPSAEAIRPEVPMNEEKLLSGNEIIIAKITLIAMYISFLSFILR